MIRDGAILVRRAKVLVVQSLLGRSKVVAVMVAVCRLLHVYINGVVVLAVLRPASEPAGGVTT